MKTNIPHTRSKQCIPAILTAILFAVASLANATDLAAWKLTGHWTSVPGSYALGYTNYYGHGVACSETWIVCGAPYASDLATQEGSVQVFSATTGAWVRQLKAPGTAKANNRFGECVAVHGNLALVGAPDFSGATAGVVHIYDLTKGTLLRTLSPSDGTALDAFGTSVAVAGKTVVVGAPFDNSNRGSAYLFDLGTGGQLAKLQASDGAAGHYFGYSVAAEGTVALVSAPAVDNNRGAVYSFNLVSFGQMRKFQPSTSASGDYVGMSLSIHGARIAMGAPLSTNSQGKVFVMNLLDPTDTVRMSSDGAAGHQFGSSVSISNGLLIAGAPFSASSRGTAYVFDLNSGATNEFQKINPPDSGASNLGRSAMLCGNTAAISAHLDSTQAPNSGAVYIFRPITRSMPLAKVLAKGDFAPGTQECVVNTLTDAFINSSGKMIIGSTLAGAGSNAGKDSALFSTMNGSSTLDLVLKSRLADGSVAIGALSKPLANNPNFSLYNTTLTGTGVSAINNQAVYTENGVQTTRLLRTGDTVTAFGGAALGNFVQVVQNRANHCAAACTLLPGIAGTNTANDSGVLWHDYGNATFKAVREGTAAAATGLTYGQFNGRVAYYNTQSVYAAAVVGTALDNQAVFQKDFASNEIVVARKGDMAVNGGGAAFSSFVGETMDDGSFTLYRATLGAPANSGNNEGLWTRSSGAVHSLVMRKGDFIPGLTGVKIAKFISFWEPANQTLALVQLAGTGVNSSNDLALILYQTTLPVSGQVTVLMREGSPAPGCGSATIGTIGRVEVEPFYGHYLVLATLAGAPAGTEQALFRGMSHAAMATVHDQPLRFPYLVLRKGALYNNQPGKVKSIALPMSNITAGGAGGSGLGRAMREPLFNFFFSNIVVTVEFDNGVRQIMNGTP